MIAGIDLFSPSSYASGHPAGQYAWLRDNDPVHWHEEPGGPGFWAVTRHEDVKAVSRNAALFSSRPTIMIDDGTAMDLGDHTMMLTMDPPRHTRYRKLVAPRFLRGARRTHASRDRTTGRRDRRRRRPRRSTPIPRASPRARGKLPSSRCSATPAGCGTTSEPIRATTSPPRS